MSQLAFSEENDPKFPWNKGHNTSNKEHNNMSNKGHNHGNLNLPKVCFFVFVRGRTVHLVHHVKTTDQSGEKVAVRNGIRQGLGDDFIRLLNRAQQVVVSRARNWP